MSTAGSATLQPMPGVPKEVQAALRELTQALATTADLAGLVLFGGLARGRYREGRSDVNLVVLLRRIDGEVLAAIAPALRDARRAAAVDTMLMTPTEVPGAALDFPTKFLDIQRHHLALWGDDPFAALEIPPSLVRRRVAQSLRNLLLRMRHRFVHQHDEPERLQAALADMARPLAIELSALLQAGGHAGADEDRTSAIYSAAAAQFGLDRDTLAQLAALRESGAPPASAQGLASGLLALLAAVADRADQLAGEQAEESAGGRS